MKEVFAVILLLLLVQTLATPIPAGRNIPGPPVPSFGNANATQNTTNTTTTVSTTTSQQSTTSAPRTTHGNIRIPSQPEPEIQAPAMIDTSAIDKVTPQPFNYELLTELSSKLNSLTMRVETLENEIRTIKAELTAINANQAISEKRNLFYWKLSFLLSILALLGVLGLISKDLFFFFKRNKKEESKDPIYSYVAQSRAAGLSDSELIQRLRAAGWDEQKILDALRR